MAGSKPVMRAITRALDLPEEVLMDLPRMILTGHEELYAENHRGILLYTHEHIRFVTRIGVVDVTGRNMELRSLAAEQLVISGELNEIRLEGKEA